MRLVVHGLIVAVVLVGLAVLFWPRADDEADHEPGERDGGPVANMTIPPPVAAIPAPAPEPAPEPISGPISEPSLALEPDVDNRDEQQAPTDLSPDLAAPDWQRYAVPSDDGAAPEPQIAQIAIVLDDMGLNEKAARRAADLPGPLTLAFLPYAQNLPAQTAHARSQGHELMVHMPMEPEGRGMDPGPNAMMTGLDKAELQRRLTRNLDQFKGYVGFNNHMGSRFTANRSGMTVVLEEAKARGLLFLDSRTTEATVSAKIARDLDLPYAARDVFLDNVRTDAAIRTQLATLVTVARKRGAAIAIGHPYPETLAVLAVWLPELEKHKIKLVPLSSLVVQNQ